MSKTLHEFKRFLAKAGPGFSPREKQLANLMLDCFDEVLESSSASGKRGRVLARIIVEKGAAAPAELEVEAESGSSSDGGAVRLSRLRVEHFRGFSDGQTFEFRNPYTFVYGPNGTGKSSLCEALEYGLLGSIHEAESKRIPVAEYVKNAVTKKQGKHELFGDTATSKDAKLSPDANRYEFCFIEKNRIDGFARVAANTPAAQQSRLAALFGLEEFNAFATQFNESIDSYMDCVGKKGKDLEIRAKAIAGQQEVLKGLPAKAKGLELRTSALVARFQECKSIGEVKAHLSGEDGNGGKLKANNTEIGRLQNLKPVADPGIDDVPTDAGSLTQLLLERAEAMAFLGQYKDQLSIRDLYAAIVGNKEKFGNSCPACASEIYSDGQLAVPQDPYANAQAKLAQFDAARKKEERIAELKKLLGQRWPEFQARVSKLHAVALAIGFPRSQDVEEFCTGCSGAKDVDGIQAVLAGVAAKEELLLAMKAALLAFNASVAESQAKIKKLEAENAAIAKDIEEIVAISTMGSANAKSEAEARQAIDKFNADNETLIKEAEAEKAGVERNRAYADAYATFRRKILDYNASLPLSLAQDLNEKTLKFYNEINKYDHKSDRLKSLTLPTAPGGKIGIEFETGEKCDALQVLSEGHIRCLGLAILLAKMTREDLPFLIFDDVVNSIDDEHRSAIIDLLLNPEEVGKRQLIITTHGEDFVKRLENAVPMKAYEKTVTRIDFLPPVAAKKISVKLDTPRHYLTVASKSFEDGRVRDSLSYARKSFEELLGRLWKKIASKDLSAQISVGMRGPGQPDLMSVATGLHKFLERKDVTVFKETVPHLAEILGQGEKHKIEWNYLNKGTHDEGQAEEFEAAVVRRMIDTMIALDDAMEARPQAAAAAPVQPT